MATRAAGAPAWLRERARGVAQLWAVARGQSLPLDALRSCAIALVFACHYAGEYDRVAAAPLPAALARVLLLGWSGVDLFFVLSGLLIGRQLWLELGRDGTVDVPRFLLRRGLRIWPLYFTFVLGIWAARPWLPLDAVLPDLLFYSNYVHAELPGGWSLSTEEQFYVVVPLALLASWKAVGPRRCATLLVIALALLPALRWLTLTRVGWPAIDQDAVTTAIYTPFHTHADALVVGVLIAWAWVHVPLEAQRLERTPVRLALAGAVLAAVVLRLLDKDLYAYTALALLFGVAVYVALHSRRVAPRAARWRGFPVLSRLSYGMYLNHLFVLKAAAPAVAALDAVAGRAPGFVAGLLATFAASAGVSALTYTLVERPFLDWRERRVARAPVRGTGL